MLKHLTPFHIAVPVRDIDEARQFYVEVLNCKVGRSSDEWIDLDLFGHQFVCHLDPKIGKSGRLKHRIKPSHGHGIPVPHYGVIIDMQEWLKLARTLTGRFEFILSPTVRMEDETGEQATMLFYDPSGNALEFKAFENVEEQLFAK